MTQVERERENGEGDISIM